MRAVAAERAVAMGKAAEPLDDRAVVLGRAQCAGKVIVQLGGSLGEQPPVGGDRFLLHLTTLGVLQRHVEEDPLHHVQRRIRARLHSREGERECLRVMRVGARTAAEDVTGKLIEQDDQAQAPPRAVGPGGELAPGRTFEQRAEAHADVLIASLAPR